jgi:hypothetical protein
MDTKFTLASIREALFYIETQGASKVSLRHVSPLGLAEVICFEWNNGRHSLTLQSNGKMTKRVEEDIK